MNEKIYKLILDIEDKGYIGAGPMRLAADPNWIELREALSEKPVKEPVKVAPKVVALPVHKSGKK